VNFFDHVVELIKRPSENTRKIVPYTRRHLNRAIRRVLEQFNVDTYSKPYLGHQELLNFIDRENGFFVEVGANDGYFQDPTYYYEKIKKWKGIMVEPLPLFEKCKNNRKRATVFNYACVPIGFDSKTVTLIDNNAMSFVKNGISNQEEWIEKGEAVAFRKHREVTVEAKTLTEIIDQYFKSNEKREIDLLCIDVEGFELQVLQGLDLKKYSPQYILVECHSEQLRQEIEDFLGENYSFLSFIPVVDYLFKRI